LCANRNFTALKFVSHHLSLQALVKHAKNMSLDENFRAHLYNLIRNVYIDREPYSDQNKPNLVRLIDPSKPKGE
jgi:hypothetical protein